MSGDPQDTGESPVAAAPASGPRPLGDGPVMSQEFFLRVNDFIQMANRIERRYDTHHAQLAFLHGFSRYSGHHFRTTATIDDAANREAFAEYIGAGVKQLILGHLEDMVGGPAATAVAAEAAGEPGSTTDATDATPTPDAG